MRESQIGCLIFPLDLFEYFGLVEDFGLADRSFFDFHGNADLIVVMNSFEDLIERTNSEFFAKLVLFGY